MFKLGIEVEQHVTLSGVHINARKLIPEFTKHNPKESVSGVVHHDCGGVEWTTNPATNVNSFTVLCTNSASFAKNLVMEKAKALDWGVHKDSDRQRAITHNVLDGHNCSALYEKDQMDSPFDLVLGCNASKNAYGERPIPINEYQDGWRHLGLHLNVESPGLSSDEATNLAKAFDLTLGLLSVIRSLNPRQERARRKLYGRAGEYRHKSFGLEYRTLPNTFYTSSVMTGALFEACKLLCETDEAYTSNVFNVEDIINNMERKKAFDLMISDQYPKWAQEVVKEFR